MSFRAHTDHPFPNHASATTPGVAVRQVALSLGQDELSHLFLLTHSRLRCTNRWTQSAPLTINGGYLRRTTSSWIAGPSAIPNGRARQSCGFDKCRGLTYLEINLDQLEDPQSGLMNQFVS
jgi:hypothetical protein